MQVEVDVVESEARQMAAKASTDAVAAEASAAAAESALPLVARKHQAALGALRQAELDQRARLVEEQATRARAAQLAADEQSCQWRRYFDEDGDAYYLNVKTQETTWDRPASYLDPKPVEMLRIEREARAKAQVAEWRAREQVDVATRVATERATETARPV